MVVVVDFFALNFFIEIFICVSQVERSVDQSSASQSRASAVRLGERSSPHDVWKVMRSSSSDVSEVISLRRKGGVCRVLWTCCGRLCDGREGGSRE